MSTSKPAGAAARPTLEHAFAADLQRGVYEAIFRRRDVREFIAEPVPDAVLARILIAAHHAASVGFTQPWDFLIVRDRQRREQVREVFAEERRKNADQFRGSRREKFLALRLEGILEAPLNLIVTCEPDRPGPAVLGKVSIREVEIYSACLAVGNLWLAARAEGVGVGWVSIVRNEALRQIFGIPAQIIPVAYLCVGYTRSFPERPLLETADWAKRLPATTLLHFDEWQGRDEGAHHRVADLVHDPTIWHAILPAPPTK